MDLMRVGGLASGMDVEEMVGKLMEAERMPLERLQQEQKTLEYKRDAFRDINSQLLELDNMMLDMKMSKTYKPKSASSSNESAVTASATSSASNGSYEISVSQLASSAINVGKSEVDSDVTFTEGTHTFHTYDEDGEKQDHTFEVKEGDSLSQVLKKITDSSEGNVRAFYEESSNRVVIEATRTGQYNEAENGREIEFDTSKGSIFNQLGLTDEETGGKNAKFTYNNGLEIESRANEYTINGLELTLHQVTDSNERISVTTDVEDSVDKIKEFVDAYNETIEQMNETQLEEKFRDYPPLTEEQRGEMTEDQIKRWEEKSKSGILRGESSIRDGMTTLRSSMQQKVETDGAYNLLSQVGITTTKNYLDGGKLEIDEEKLRTAVRENPDDVFKLFSNNDKEEARGLINRFDDALDRTRGNIERKAGKSTQTLDNYQIGKEIKQLNTRIGEFEDRMQKVEQRYWNQFTAMEKAINEMNQQSSQLMSQFGDM